MISTENKSSTLTIPTSLSKSRLRSKIKYNNEICYIDNKCFRSKHEAKFYSELVLRKKAKDISDFECQVAIHLPPLILAKKKGLKTKKYIVDFVVEHLDGSKEWIDTKGVKTELYKLKKLLVKFFYDIDIKEIY